MTAGEIVDGRTRHYGTFYGSDPAPARDGRPLLLVWGNCQAESIRVLLSGSATLEAETVRIPPVFELTPSDIEPLRRLASSASILLSQPVKDDYRDLPLGTRQVAAMMRPDTTIVRWPVVRWAGLHPFQAIVRDPRDPSRDPPVVPYHDLRTLASARADADLFDVEPTDEACRAIAGASSAELRRREVRDCDVGISDLFDHPESGDMFTINHPGNRVLVELSRRLQRALGRPGDAADPGRDLLGAVSAPIDGAAAALFDLPAAVDCRWRIGDGAVAASEIHQTQLRWYRDNPWVVDAGYARHRATMETLGLA
jgi:hypothetical protein